MENSVHPSYGEKQEKHYFEKAEGNRENSNGLGLYIVSTLLKNYKIPYEASERDGKFIFCIKLSR